MAGNPNPNLNPSPDPNPSPELVWQAEHELPIFAVALAPSPPAAAGEDADAKAPLLLAAASGTVVILHDASTGAALRRLAAGRDGLLNALAFSPCGRCLLAAGSSEVVHAFHVPAGTRRAVVRLTRSGWSGGLNTATINALAFVGEGSFLSGGYDATLTRWQLEPVATRDAPELSSLSIEELRSLIRRLAG